MNRAFASPLTPALSPDGGEGEHGRADGWFMGSGHGLQPAFRPRRFIGARRFEQEQVALAA